MVGLADSVLVDWLSVSVMVGAQPRLFDPPLVTVVTMYIASSLHVHHEFVPDWGMSGPQVVEKTLQDVTFVVPVAVLVGLDSEIVAEGKS